MDKKQANTVVGALMEPGRQAHELNRQRMQAKAKAEAKRRRYTWPHFFGLLIGALATYVAGRFLGLFEVTGDRGIWTVITGAVTGALLARLVVAVRHYRAGD